jgi:hypothetical protein
MQSAGTLVNLLPQHSLMLPVSPKTNSPLIPIYQADDSFYALVSEQRFERPQSGGLLAWLFIEEILSRPVL